MTTDLGRWVTAEMYAAAQARVAELEDACMALLAAYEDEEDERGFPFNFELREAHRRLAAVVHVEKKGDGAK